MKKFKFHVAPASPSLLVRLAGWWAAKDQHDRSIFALILSFVFIGGGLTVFAILLSLP